MTSTFVVGVREHGKKQRFRIQAVVVGSLDAASETAVRWALVNGDAVVVPAGDRTTLLWDSRHPDSWKVFSEAQWATLCAEAQGWL